jgi:AraC-like DNA-binding protein
MPRFEDLGTGRVGALWGLPGLITITPTVECESAVPRTSPPGCLTLLISVDPGERSFVPAGNALLIGPSTRYQHKAGASYPTLRVTVRPSQIGVAEEPWRRGIRPGTHVLPRGSPAVGLIADLVLEPSEQLPTGSLSSGVIQVYADPVQWARSISKLVQMSFPPAGNPAVWSRRRDIVHDACAFLRRYPRQPVGLAELAGAALASERALQYAFRDILGMTPTSYQRICALHSVRHDLRHAGLGETVSDIAMRWGFWHLGRFSATYRGMFAELPSATRQLSLPDLRQPAAADVLAAV